MFKEFSFMSGRGTNSHGKTGQSVLISIDEQQIEMITFQ